MFPLLVRLLAAGLLSAPFCLLGQTSFFQHYFHYPGHTLHLNDVTPLAGGQLAAAGHVVSESTGQQRAALMLFSGTGSLIWARQFGNDIADPSIQDLEPTADGKLLAVLSSGIDFGEYGIAKIDLTGALEWSRFFFDHPNFELHAAQSVNGGFVLTGKAVNGDALIKKTDPNGVEIWSVALDFPGAADMLLGQVWVDPQGALYVAGSMLQNGYRDGVIVKLSSTGQLEWSRRYGTSESDALFYLKPASDNSLLAGGYSYGFDERKKGWLLKIDPSGAIKWSNSYKVPGADADMRNLQVYPGGAVFSLSEEGSAPSLGAGVARTNTAGDLLWVKNYNQAGSFGLNPQLAVANNNDLIMAAALQTGSGRGCLLARLNADGDAPPCCLKSANLAVQALAVNNSVFVPGIKNAVNLTSRPLESSPFTLQSTVLCIPASTDFSVSDTLICPGDCVELELLNPTPGASYAWTYPGGVSDPDDPNRICFPHLETAAIIALTANGCPYQRQQVTVQPKTGSDRMPNAFTPNGDQINDRFLPLLPCPLPGYYLEVFNRWGARIFSSRDPDEGWDGTVGGQEAPSDVYLWVLEFQTDNGLVRQKGNVTLLR